MHQRELWVLAAAGSGGESKTSKETEYKEVSFYC
jgi:hypothetical protein